MIAWLEGHILEKNPPYLVVVVNGIGYWVETSTHTFFQLPEEGQKINLHIHTIIREDAHLLYGFYDKAEREMFQCLIKISGIGPKSALAVLSGMPYQELAQCIVTKNLVALGKLPGIGKKTAERLVIEMQDKIKNLAFLGAMPNNSSENGLNKNMAMSSLQPFPWNFPAVQDAMSALTALGYKTSQITSAINTMAQVVEMDAQTTSEQVIREALKYFTRV